MLFGEIEAKEFIFVVFVGQNVLSELFNLFLFRRYLKTKLVNLIFVYTNKP